MNMLGKITGMLGGSKLDPFISKGFSMFDKDGSGFIDGPEAKAAAEKVLGLAGISVPQSAVDTVMNKVAGPDQKLDKAEFTALMHQLLASAPGQQPAAHVS